jgi:hypothetical protein
MRLQFGACVAAIALGASSLALAITLPMWLFPSSAQATIIGSYDCAACATWPCNGTDQCVSFASSRTRCISSSPPGCDPLNDDCGKQLETSLGFSCWRFVGPCGGTWCTF